MQRDLARLLRDQEALADHTREVGRRTLTLDLRDLPPRDAADLAAAADRQLELAQSLDRSVGRDGAVERRSRSTEARRLAVGEQMRRTAEQIRQNEVGHAAAGQKQIAAALRTLSEMLAGRAGETAEANPAMKQCFARRRADSRSKTGCLPWQSARRPGRSAWRRVRRAASLSRRRLRKTFGPCSSGFGANCRNIERGQVQQWAVEDFPPKYEAMIEEYYRRLSEQKGEGKR